MWVLQSGIDIIYIAFLTSMNNIKEIRGFSPVAGFFLIALAFSILLVASTTRGVIAQNLTINASNAVGNTTAAANQTGTEVAKNVSSSGGNASKSANQTMTALGNNASGTMNKTGPSNNRQRFRWQYIVDR